VGRPLVEMFREAKLPAKLQPVFIKTGEHESSAHLVHNVAKVVLISSVQVPLQQRRLKFARSLRDTPMLVKELLNYRTKTTQSTRM